ncbi:MAG: polysaccharide deacetylase family protein [Candidatus Omnitrophica bacterium]|nr:polysaccharide deacetylase family protein [Candidatus Omnitrophota bacterium]
MKQIALLTVMMLSLSYTARAVEPVPDKTVVLTFDDAVKSHRTFVGPLLKELGFSATFFVTQAWMSDTENFMNWKDIAELHEMGFEIGNHTWSHLGLSKPERAERVAEELALVESELAKVGVPKPTSFAWPGNGFGPEGLAELRKAGILLARRGMQPEQPYGKMVPGPLYDPRGHDPLLIPTSADAYPEWTLGHFRAMAERAKDGKMVILQFHGVPDVAHPWVHTPPENFREYMNHLKSEGYHVLALRDVERFIDRSEPIRDPTTEKRHPPAKSP